MFTRNFTQPLLLATLLVGHMNSAPADEMTLSLAGTWDFRLDAEDVGVVERWFAQKFDDTIQLPGTTDTNQKGVFAAGDMRTGQSLVVRCINEGRESAREIDAYLMGHSNLEAKADSLMLSKA